MGASNAAASQLQGSLETLQCVKVNECKSVRRSPVFDVCNDLLDPPARETQPLLEIVLNASLTQGIVEAFHMGSVPSLAGCFYPEDACKPRTHGMS